MVNQYHIPQAKALFAAGFMEYMCYGVIYMIEGAKYSEMKAANSSNISQNAGVRGAQHQEVPQSSAAKSVDMEMQNEGGDSDGEGDGEGNKTKPSNAAVNLQEIEIEVDNDEEVKESEAAPERLEQFAQPHPDEEVKVASESNHQAPMQVLEIDPSIYTRNTVASKSLDEAAAESNELHEFSNLNFLILVAKNYQKSSLWFNVVIALLAMRGASSFSVLLAFVSLVLRLNQAVAVVLQKKQMAQISYGIATFLILLMWFNEFGRESADIVHEAHPELDQDGLLTRQSMFPNYKP